MASGSFSAPGGNTGLISPGFGKTCELVPVVEDPIPELRDGTKVVGALVDGSPSVDGPMLDGPMLDGPKVDKPGDEGLSVGDGADDGADWYVGGPIGVTLIAPGTFGTVGTLGTMADETP